MMSRPQFIVPSAPVLVSAPPTGKDWLHEVKWDGWRIQIIKHHGVRIYSRTRTDFTKRLPGIVEAVERLKASACIIDAELVATDFYDIAAAIKRGQVTAIAFDLMHLDDEDLRRLPLTDRKAKLKKLVGKGGPSLRLSAVYPDGVKLLAAAAELELEGIVSKKRDSMYQSAKCLTWLKVKTAVWREANKHRGELFQRKRKV